MVYQAITEQIMMSNHNTLQDKADRAIQDLVAETITQDTTKARERDTEEGRDTKITTADTTDGKLWTSIWTTMWSKGKDWKSFRIPTIISNQRM